MFFQRLAVVKKQRFAARRGEDGRGGAAEGAAEFRVIPVTLEVVAPAGLDLRRFRWQERHVVDEDRAVVLRIVIADPD